MMGLAACVSTAPPIVTADGDPPAATSDPPSTLQQVMLHLGSREERCEMYWTAQSRGVALSQLIGADVVPPQYELGLMAALVIACPMPPDDYVPPAELIARIERLQELHQAPPIDDS